MAEPARVCSLSELKDGAGAEFVVNGVMVALFRSGDSVTALNGLCPHAGGPIGTGTVRNHIVTCPWHGWQFDVRNGQHCLSESIRATTYEVAVEGDDVYVTVPE